MKFKKTLFILCILICLFAMANVSAGDANDNNLTSLNTQIDDLNIDSIENEKLQSDINSNDILKTPKTIIVNNSNVDDIFSGENDTLGDSVNEGDTLDFNGTIDKNRYLVINKPVNIISTSKNAVINLHTVIGDSVNNIPKFSFVITEGASGSNISDLYINNTQTWIYNVDNVYFKNVEISVRSAANLGDKIGHTAIRFCNHITFDGCSIFTENTQVSCLVLYVTSNFTFINSKIEGQGKIGPIITFECPNEIYGAPYDDYEASCTNNTIRNSVIKTGYPDAIPIENINADHTTIDGVKVYASKNIGTGDYANVTNSNFYNASGINLGSYGVAYNNTVDGSSSSISNGAKVYNNTFNSVSIGNGVFENNTVKSKLTVSSPANVKYNNLSSIDVNSGSKYSNITDNNISGTITVNEISVTIKFNNIKTDNEYAVKVNKKGAVVTNNVLRAKTKFGDNAVSRYQDSTVVEDNDPQPSYMLLKELINKPTGSITLGQDYYFNEPYGDDDTVLEGIVIGKDLTIIGNGYTIDGMDLARIFQINNGAQVTIENLNFINAKAHSEDYGNNNHDVGGAITVKMGGNLTIINCSFTNNNAEQNGWGGAIFITGNSTLSIITSNFTDSYAQDGGNVLYALDGNYVSVLDSNIDGINIADIDIDDIGSYIANDKGEMGLLAPIKILTTPNLIVNVEDNTEGEEAVLIMKEPNGFNGRASLTIDGQTIPNIQFNDGIATIKLDVAPARTYNATITNDYTECCKDIGINLAYLYAPATAATNEFMVYKNPNIQFNISDITYGETQAIKATINGTGNATIKLNGQVIAKDLNVSDGKIECPIEGFLTADKYIVEVSYTGDEVTSPGLSSINFTVNKADPQMQVIANSHTYGDVASVIALVNASGNVTIKVNGSEKTIGLKEGEGAKENLKAILNEIAIFNGKATLDIYGLNADAYPVEVTFNGNDNYNAKTVNAKFEVFKRNSTLTVKDIVFDYNDAGSIEVSITNAYGIIAEVINQPDAIVNVTGNVITVSTLDAGNYTLSVTTIPDDNHNPVNKTVKIIVNKVNSTLAVNGFEFDYNSTGATEISFTGASGVRAEVINQSNAIVNVKDNVIEVSGLDAGSYTLAVTTLSDENHKSVTKLIPIKVFKLSSEVKIDVKTNYIVGESFDIIVTGNTVVGVTINNKTYEIKDGKVNIDTTALKAGTYTVIAYVAENNNFLASSDNATFTISELPIPQIDIDVESDVFEGTDLEVIVSIGDATGIVNINGENITLVNGKASTTIKDVKAGDLTIEVTYLGDDKHFKSSKSIKVNVHAKKDVDLTVAVEDIKVGETATVNVGINPDVTGKVTVDGNEISIVNGKGTYTISNLAVASYLVTVKFAGDNNFGAVEKTVSFKVIDIEAQDTPTVEPEITIHSLEEPSENGTVIIELPSDATGTVTLTVDNESYTFDVINGKADVVLPNLDNGDYNYSITYSGDVKYSKMLSFNRMNVLKMAIDVDSSSLDSTITDEPVIVNLPSDATGTVTISVEGQNYTFAVENGKVDVDIPGLTNGDHNYTISYSGDWKYSKFTKEGNLTVNKTKDNPNNNTSVVDYSSIKAANVKVIYAAGSYYTVAVYGTDGKLSNGARIVITVKGKTFKTLTTKNGVAKFKVTNVPGTYRMTITSLGKSITRTLTVKHLVTLKTVSVKRSAKKLVLTAALGKVNKKYLKNKKITFKFNGKKYVAKTNKKGIAKVTIKSNVLKKLKVGKKVTYQATFLKDTVKKTVKVRK